MLPDADLHRLLVVLLLTLTLTLRRRRRPLDLDVALLGCLDLNLWLLLLRHRLEADRWERLVGVEGGAVVVHDSVDAAAVDGLVLVGVDRGRARCPRGQNADLEIEFC